MTSIPTTRPPWRAMRQGWAWRAVLLTAVMLALAWVMVSAGGWLAPAAAAATQTSSGTPTDASTDTGTEGATGTATAGYRFWGYFQQVNGVWEFSQTGAASTSPADGSVEGWRFATAASDDPRYPRAIPAFEDVCADTKAAAGQKRVAVVVDYGRVADNADGSEPPKPRAACAAVPENATGADVLADVAQTRIGQGGLVCGVDGYPASGCGDPVNPLPAEAVEPDEQVQLTGVRTGDTNDTAAARDSAQTDDGGPGAALWVGVGVVVLAAVIGLAALRRRSTGD